MQLTDLIENAVSALAAHGNITVNIEAKDNGEWIRRLVPCIDIKNRGENNEELVFVIQGGREDNIDDSQNI